MADSTPEKENIVVVGGGAVGTLLTRRLAAKLDKKKYDLFLVTATPFYTHLPACIRTLVTSTGTLDDAVHVPYAKLFTQKDCRIIIGKVTSIEESLPYGRGNGSGRGGGGKLGLDTGVTLKFSVVILATGCTWEGPLDFPVGKEARENHLGGWRKRFESAEDVVIVGGGATGLEFAGEIRDLSPTKRITVVHDKPLLLNEAYPDSFRKTVAKNLRRRDVGIITDDAIHNLEISEASTIRTASGRLLVADLVIPCRGPRPNTDFLSTLGDDADFKSRTETGYVKVLPTFQLYNHPRIFAAGDIIEWDEQKQAVKYDGHADIVVKNVLDVLKNKQPNALYHGRYETIVISNGKHGGSTYYSFWGPHMEFGDFVSTVAKNKSLKAHSTLGSQLKV